MYKGNGETKIFPMPPGASGHSVALITAKNGTWMNEGEAYVIQGEDIVFKIAPPVGTEVVFVDADSNIPKIPTSRKTMTVIYGDGTVETVTEDPTVLLAEAREMFKRSQEMLKAAVSAQDAVRIIVAEEREIAKETLSGRLARYEGLVEESVKSAASMARDDLTGVFNSKLLEIRNKHKATIEAHDAVQTMLRGAKSELSALTDEVVARMGEQTAPLMNALEEMRGVMCEVREARDAAQNAAASAGADVIRTFGEHAALVLEGIKSVKSALNTEVKSVIDAAQRTMNAEIEQARAHRDLAGQAARRAEEVERKASEMVGR